MIRGLPVAVSGFLALACAHNVPQDKATATDGRIKGAKQLTLENGEATDTGIVTYPGGDRIDWKVIELPEKQRGTLDVKLSWTTPRPGLQLAFDVFDEWNTLVTSSAKTTRKQGKGRNRLATVKAAKGKYFVRVYAVGRGDAGRYKLGLEFKQTLAQGPIDWLKIPINDPPRLADLPGIVIPCDEFQPDLNNPECKKICFAGAPANWSGCKNTCTANPPDPAIPICAQTMACPKPKADRRVMACRKIDFVKCPDPRNPDRDNPNCDDVTIPPAYGRILGKQIQGKEVIVTIGVGAKSGVGKDWKGEVLQGGTPTLRPAADNPMSGGTLTSIRVDGDVTVGRTTLTPDQLTANPWVRLSAPKPAP